MDIPKPDIEGDALCLDFLEDLIGEKQEDPPVTMSQLENFRALVGMCGLTMNELAPLIGLKPQSLRRKVIGERALRRSELNGLIRIWSRIAEGDVADLPEGAKRASRALDAMRALVKRNGRLP